MFSPSSPARQSVQLEIERELRKRLCPVCDARAESAPPQDLPHLRIRIARLQLRNADKFYKDGDVEHARAALDEIVTYSEQARDSAVETKKHLKNIEITVRKIAERLRDIKRTLAPEDQAPVDQAVQRLEEVRTSLLQRMFSKDK